MDAETILALQLLRLETKILGRLDQLEILLMTHAEALAALQAAVAAENTVIASAVTLINGIADRIAAAGDDTDALAALTADIRAQADGLAAAVNANQVPAPAGPAPAPAPAPADQAPSTDGVVTAAPAADASTTATTDAAAADPVPGAAQ
jgi:hypothetical protein